MEQTKNIKWTFFGMRRYLRGAWMSLHVDRLPSHIISVILQVIQIKI